MNQTENPLDKLRDIHLPDQLDGFQLAPGWWLLLFILLCLVIWWIVKTFKKRKALYLLKPLSSEIDALAKLPANSDSLAHLSALLKRVTLVYFPKKEVSSLSGSDWVNFINEQQPAYAFDEKQSEMLAHFLYQKSPQVNDHEWQSLIQKSHKLLEAVIREQVTGKTRGAI